MKTTQTLLKLIILLFLTSGIQSCKKSDTDTQSPSIVMLEPNSGDQFSSGSTLSVIATFHDYIELGKYRIVIRWNTDVQNISPNPETTAWDFLVEEPLSGNNKSINKIINVPANIKLGNYDLILYCTDKAGNEVSKTEIVKIVG